MQEYLAPKLVSIVNDMLAARVGFSHRDAADPEDVKDVSQGKKWLKPWALRVFEEAKFLGLPSMMRQALRIHRSCDAWDSDTIDRELDQLNQRFDEETESLTLFYLPVDKREFYNKTDLLGDDFKAAFPRANTEMTEAGNCFAFDRFTACAFHLMRSLEVVLKVLFVDLGLAPISTAGSQNWNGILREIRGKLDADKSIPNHDFYDTAYAFLQAAKNPMRNATMHVDAIYDEISAKRLFDAVSAFMGHAATKLKEI